MGEGEIGEVGMYIFFTMFFFILRHKNIIWKIYEKNLKKFRIKLGKFFKCSGKFWENLKDYRKILKFSGTHLKKMWKHSGNILEDLLNFVNSEKIVKILKNSETIVKILTKFEKIVKNSDTLSPYF